MDLNIFNMFQFIEVILIDTQIAPILASVNPFKLASESFQYNLRSLC